jgi:Ser/Thr protein kinase RdoA (MazF antagonist)
MASTKQTYPRSREQTSEPIDAKGLLPILRQHWGHEVLDIRQAQSRRVHFVQWPHCRVVVRTNPGWDGPTDPSVIVNYVHHMSQQGAPAPSIELTSDGSLSLSLGDQIISVESFIPGRTADLEPVPGFDSLGDGLAALHRTGRSFTGKPLELRPAGEYIKLLLGRSMTRTVGEEASESVTRLYRSLVRTNNDLLAERVPWILCRGDVRDMNTIVTPDNKVRFIDFDSAEFAPALFDLVMPRIQWTLGKHYTLLNAVDTVQIVRGYHAGRPLTDAEWRCYPLVWAAYYADRMTFLLHRRQQGTRHKEIDLLLDHVLNLPETAVGLGQDVVDSVRDSLE